MGSHVSRSSGVTVENGAGLGSITFTLTEWSQLRSFTEKLISLTMGNSTLEILMDANGTFI